MTEEQSVSSALVRIEGKLETLQVKVDAGDRQATSLVDLLKLQVSSMQVQLGEIKDTLSAQRAESQNAVNETRAHGDAATSAVRVDLERQLTEHSAERFLPHAETRRRIEGLEAFRTQAKVVIALVAVVIAPAIGAGVSVAIRGL